MNPTDIARSVITRNIETMEVLAPGGRLCVTCQSVAALQVSPGEVLLAWYNLGPDKQPNPLKLGSIALQGTMEWRDWVTHVEIQVGPCLVRLSPARLEYPIVLLPGHGDQGRRLARQKMSMAAIKRMVEVTTDPALRGILERALREVTEIVARMDHGAIRQEDTQP